MSIEGKSPVPHFSPGYFSDPARFTLSALQAIAQTVFYSSRDKKERFRRMQLHRVLQYGFQFNRFPREVQAVCLNICLIFVSISLFFY
jgi:hypothetical protein